MSLDHLRRRLDQAERRIGIGKSGLGRTPALWITTRSDQDRAEQIAHLTAVGQYEPDRLMIEWRVVTPYPELKEMDRELRRPSPPSGPH